VENNTQKTQLSQNSAHTQNKCLLQYLELILDFITIAIKNFIIIDIVIKFMASEINSLRGVYYIANNVVIHHFNDYFKYILIGFLLTNSINSAKFINFIMFPKNNATIYSFFLLLLSTTLNYFWLHLKYKTSYRDSIFLDFRFIITKTIIAESYLKFIVGLNE
jgi:hypothetical protein